MSPDVFSWLSSALVAHRSSLVAEIIAQAPNVGLIAGWAVWLIIVAGLIGIVLIVIRAAGLVVPGWVVQILWVLLAVIVGVLAIKILLSLV